MHATRSIDRPAASGVGLTDQIDHHLAHGRRVRAQALRHAGSRVGQTLGSLRRAIRARLHLWAAERSLRLLSDRSLADIGIPRHAIHEAVRAGPGHVRAGEPAGHAPVVRPIAQRVDLWRERQRRQQRLVRELEAYSDRDLEDLGIFRSDIRRVAKAA